MAERAVGDEPFVLLYPDDLLVSQHNPVKRMIEAYDEYQAPIMGLYSVPRKDVTKYGIAQAKHIRGKMYEVFGFVEKPTLEKAPSNLASIKGYVLPPDIFTYLKRVRRGHGGEIWLIDAIQLYNKKHAVFGCELDGKLYDLGSKLGWLKANVEFGLRHPQFGPEFRSYLKSLKT
jgi:UTP--glucose-1-phosphate uridylyltransferase